MKISFSGKTDRGKVRRKNEDFYLIDKLGDDEYIFIVADGMGGHLAGEIASRMASEIVRDGMKSAENRKNPFPLLKSLFEEANRRIYAEGTLNPSRTGMGTTLTVLYIKGDKGYIVHVGDSRVYRIFGNRITKLTTDHSLVEKLLREGSITMEEALSHPKRNILYQSVGVYGEIHPQMVGPLTIKEGDVFVLCSDGLFDYVDEDEIRKIASSLSPDDATKKFIDLANKRGGGDNITVIVVKIPKMEIFEEEQKVGWLREFLKNIDIPALVFVILLILGFFLGGFYLHLKAKKILSSSPRVSSVEK